MFDDAGTSLWYQSQLVYACNANGSQALVANGIVDTVNRSQPTVFPASHSATDGAHNATANKWYYLSGGQLYSAIFTPYSAPQITAMAAPTQASGYDLTGTYLPMISHLVNPDGEFQLEFLRAASDAGEPQVECSSDLNHWEPLTLGNVSSITEQDGVKTYRMTVPVTPDMPRCFFRVLRAAAPN
jgi:hypothetical protein